VHIIAEEALRHLLATRLGTDECAVEKMHLSFYGLTHLALTGTASNSLLQALLALNEARNKAAHKLDDTNF
jgi:hypothetical protein